MGISIRWKELRPQLCHRLVHTLEQVHLLSWMGLHLCRNTQTRLNCLQGSFQLWNPMICNYFMGGIFQYLAEIRNVKKKILFFKHFQNLELWFHNNLKGLETCPLFPSLCLCQPRMGRTGRSLVWANLSLQFFFFFFCPGGSYFCLICFTDINVEENMVQLFLSHFEIKQNTI